MFERFTGPARQVVLLAQEEARMLGHEHIGTEHLLLGLTHQDESIAAAVLTSVGVTLETVRPQVEEIVGRGEHTPEGSIPFTPRIKTVLQLALREAVQLGENLIATGHLLLALVREGEGVGVRILDDLGVDLEQVRREARQLLGDDHGTSTPRGGRRVEGVSSPLLDRLGQNLTRAAREGMLDPVIGREQEVERVMQVLSRRATNNAVLFGEPGVETSPVVEGLARAIALNDVPETLKHKQVYAVDLPGVASDSGASDQHWAEILEEIRACGDVLLFVRELDGDAAATLCPALERGELQVVGATASDEFRRELIVEPTYGDVFQIVDVAELSAAHTIELLKGGVRDRYEAHHRVSITDPALVAAVVLARRYVGRSRLPDSARDVLDEAGARSRMRRLAGPPDVREFEEKIAEVRREKEAAIDGQDFERATVLRDTEKELIGRKSERETQWRSGDLGVVVEVDDDDIVEAVSRISGTDPELLRRELAHERDPRVPVGPSDDLGTGLVLLNDQPVRGSDPDLLGSRTIATEIAILLSEVVPPFVLAVDGSWGMGKSTLLNQIQDSLPSSEVVPIRFNAWTARSENALESLIRSVLERLDRNLLRRWLRRLMKKQNLLQVARIGLAVLFRLAGGAGLVDELWKQIGLDEASRNDLRTTIHDILSEWVRSGAQLGRDRKLVIFIDDLDRCDDAVVMTVCEAVKLYLDAPGLIFVIGCDLAVVARDVSGGGPDVLDEGRNLPREDRPGRLPGACAG